MAIETVALRAFRRAVHAFACVLFLALPILGQDRDETTDQSTFADKITVTATGEEQRLDKLPVSGSVITREEIEDSQEESVADLLRRLPAVTALDFGDEGTVTSTFVRGTESDHVLALYDGVRLNSPYFAGYDWSVQTTAGVERIEVVKGPFSALWGSDAIGGVINVIPARGTNGSKVQLVAEAGDDDWQRLEGSLGWAEDEWDVHASTFDREGRGQLDNSDFSNQQLLLDAGYTWSSNQRAAVLYQRLDSEIGIPFIDPLNLSPNRRQDTKQDLLALPVNLQPTPQWGLQLTPSVVKRRLSLSDPDDPFGFTSSDTSADTLQIRLASHHSLAVDGSAGHALSWGGEWREDTVDASSNFGISLDSETVELTGLFAQDVWRPNDRATVIVGLRYDNTDQWGSEVSPRLSLGLLANDHVELRASYGEAFRQPSVGELFFPFSGNPNLEPERSQSAELGLGLHLGAHTVDAALFATDTDNLIDFQFATFSFANSARAKIRGAEIAWTAPITRAVSSTLQATWLDTEDQGGLPLLRRPEWSSSLVVNGLIHERWRADLAVLFVGSRADVDAITFARKSMASYTTASLSLSYQLIGGLELTLRGQNLADRGYQQIDGYPAAGRRFTGGIRWTM